MSDVNTIDSIEEAALRLQPDARVKLARSIVESLAALSEPELADLWLREAERRDQEMDAGATAGVSGDDVFEDIRARHDK